MNMRKEIQIKDVLMKYGFVIILILVTVFFGVTTNNFFTVGNLLSILHNAAPVFVFAAGAAMIIMEGDVDLSIGSTMYLTAAVATILISRKGMPVPIVLLIVAAVCVGIGAFNGWIIHRFDMSPMIATMAVMITIRGLAQQISNGVAISLPDFLRKLNSVKIGGIYMDIFLAAAVLLLTEALHRKTSFGRHVTAVGNDRRIAGKLGVNVRSVMMKNYIYCSLLAGFAGLLTAIQTGGVASTFGSGKEFTAISVAAIGGISMSGGSGRILSGVVLGVLTLNIIESGLNFAGASPYAYRFVQGGIIFVAMYVQSYQSMIRVRAKKTTETE